MSSALSAVREFAARSPDFAVCVIGPSARRQPPPPDRRAIVFRDQFVSGNAVPLTVPMASG
jgi:hypothetical protein